MNEHQGVQTGPCPGLVPARIAQTIEHDAHAVSYEGVALPDAGSKGTKGTDHWGARFFQGRERLLSSWRRPRPASPSLAPPVDITEAEEFVRAFHAENPGSWDLQERLDEVRASVRRLGTYVHTFPELQWAAKAAWRHAGRCSGRDKWRTLRVRDRRTVSDPQEVAAETIAHLREATAGGHIRSWITLFAPDTPERPGPRILNSQAVRYAGYRKPADGITGDPLNVALTELAMSLGWEGDGTAFDVLPLIVADSDARLHMVPVPRDAVLEVPITHPEFDWFAELGLRWHAVPVISDMYLEAGGIRYPCAPFNGWYQASTEVGVRNLGDPDRYNMLPAVAAGMGLDMSSVTTFWPDRAAVELAVAVQHSFRTANVMATDHHTEARRFVQFAEAEESSGRPWCADWSWINPPISASTTPTFHRTYPDRVIKPGFFRHEDQVTPMTQESDDGPPCGRPVA
jgi:nitric-oxide synthase, bacterial